MRTESGGARDQHSATSPPPDTASMPEYGVISAHLCRPIGELSILLVDTGKHSSDIRRAGPRHTSIFPSMESSNVCPVIAPISILIPAMMFPCFVSQ